jgi:pyridoxamine 5'-phosphate oxidase
MNEPLELFRKWFAEAQATGMKEPTAMSLATVDAGGHPEVRMVLFKQADENGFAFFTNLESPKSQALRVHPEAAICIHWMPLARQIRIRGGVTPVTDAEADAYFATRPRLSQLGAWASRQSRVMKGYFELETEVAKVALRFPFGPVPRPPFWSGFRVTPREIEFWTEKPFRRHERILFTREGEGWKKEWLFP